MPFKKILIAVDHDESALQAAELGSRLASELGAKISLIFVAATESAITSDTVIDQSELISFVETDGKQLLEGLAKRIPGVSDVFLRSGVPGEEIVKVAHDWAADVVVIGSHGRGAIRRAICGSVVDSVMKEASCPVLVVREGT